MKEESRQRYIRIKNTDFPHPVFKAAKDSQLRSLEKYCEKNNRKYDCDNSGCIVDVSDESDAMEVGMHFDLRSVKYYDGLNLRTLVLYEKKKRGRPQNTVFDHMHGKGMTVNQSKKQFRRELRQNCLSKSEVVKRKLIAKGELEKMIANGSLTVSMVGKSFYIDRQELFTYLKSKTNLV